MCPWRVLREEPGARLPGPDRPVSGIPWVPPVTNVALDLSPHLRAARRALLYMVVGLGQGLTYLLVVGGGLVLGVVLAPLWVGLPLLAGAGRVTWRLAGGGGGPADRAVGAPPPPDPPPA